MQRIEEQQESAGLKIKIMAQAHAMQYDDDVDEDVMYSNQKYTSKYKVEVIAERPKENKVDSKY